MNNPETKELVLDAIQRAKAELQRMEDAVNTDANMIDDVLAAADLINQSAIVEALLRFGQFCG